MNYKFAFTVFTPTYNRASTLHRVYESLSAQTFRDFEWLVIDDGSTDDTDLLIHTWERQAHFPIRYIWQCNQGKHLAFNRAVQEAMGELFLPLDSDDACVPQALERFYYHWQNIPIVERSRFSGVTVLCKNEEGRLIGRPLPRQTIDSDSLEMRYKYRLQDEMWGFHRTDVLKVFPFPSHTNASFVPEGIIWSKIARQFKTRFVNETLRVYYQDFRGITNPLSRSRSPAKDAEVLLLWHQSVLNEDMEWFLYSPWTFFRTAVHYSRFSFHVRRSVLNQLTRLRLIPRLLYLVFSPIGFVVFLRDIYKRRISDGVPHGASGNQRR